MWMERGKQRQGRVDLDGSGGWAMVTDPVVAIIGGLSITRAICLSVCLSLMYAHTSRIKAPRASDSIRNGPFVVRSDIPTVFSSLSLSLSLSVRVCLFTHPIHSHIYVHRTVGMFDRPYCSFRPASRSTMRLRQCLICMHRHSLAAPRGHRAAQCTPHLAHRWRDRVSSRFSSRW